MLSFAFNGLSKYKLVISFKVDTLVLNYMMKTSCFNLLNFG